MLGKVLGRLGRRSALFGSMLGLLGWMLGLEIWDDAYGNMG